MSPHKLAVCCAAALAACAPEIVLDESETDIAPIDGPTVEFDPGSSIIPFPNNLLLDPSTGRVNLPEQCNETETQTALREGVLNTLDGFGTFKPVLRATFTEAVAPDSLDGRVRLYRRATGSDPVAPGEAEALPIILVPGQTARFTADCSDSSTIDAVNIVPLVPLVAQSTYSVVIERGVTTADGEEFLPSLTWALVRQSENPVEVEGQSIVGERTPFDPTDPDDIGTLLGIDLLWKAHAQVTAFAEATGTDRGNLLLAWDFNTQTIKAPLDASVDGSPASNLSANPVASPTEITGGDPTAFLTSLGIPCETVNCDAVGGIYSGGITTPNYQVDTPNPLGGGDPIPGPWPDPVAPIQNGDNSLQLLFSIPAADAPTEGYPIVVFGHGLGGQKENAFAIMSQLSEAGFAVVAIDAVAHGSRAVQNSDDAALGCSDSPVFSEAPQCFSPMLSTNLAATRDNFRQTFIDSLGLIEAIKSCSATPCEDFDVDANRIGYLGMSLSGILGQPVSAMSTDLAASVSNVGGAGWLDIIENSETPEIVCPLVNGLIAAGVLTGTPAANPATPVEGDLCFTDDWTTQASYQSFAAVARWILDPADPANFTRTRLETGLPVLVQQVIGDTVIPAVATEQLGALYGLSPQEADVAVPPVQPSSAIIANPTAFKWVTYENVPESAVNSFPGNSFGHSSILRPIPDPNATLDPAAGASLGTARMQTDAITYLFNNLQ